jgi:hypothetical protein
MKGRLAMKVIYPLLTSGMLALSITGAAVAEDGEQIVPCKDLPAAIMTAFAKAYPKATIKNCTREIEDGNTTYEVASREDNVGRDVLYNAEGNVIVVEETVSMSDVPKPVQRAFNKKFSKAEIILAEKLMRGSSVSYEFEIKVKGKIREIVFDSAGKEMEP